MRISLCLAFAACGGKSAAPDDAAPVPRPVADAAVKPPAPADAAASAPVRPEHAVFGLVDNRHAAHRYIDGDLVLDAADIGFTRYARFSLPVARWHVGHVVGGVRAAIADREASLEVPMDLAMASSVDRVVMRVHGRAKQRLAMRINGRPIGKTAKSSRVELVDGWQTVTLRIEPRLASGENQISIAMNGPADTLGDRLAFEWVRFAAKDRTVAADPRAAARFHPKANAIELARGATLVWYVPIPDGAHLVAGVEGQGCKVDVRATTSDDSFTGGVLDADDTRIDLTKLSGRVAGLTLTTRDCDRATIIAPEIRVHGAPVARATRTKAAPPKYVVLWVMDALRADKVPVFTPGARARTPNLDELAKTSTVFRQYYVQGNESQTSHSSMWTGLYPAVHRVRVAGTGGTEKLDVKLPVLAEKLADAGLHTSGITGNGYVFADAGYARGFKEFRNLMREATGPTLILGKAIVDAALARLDAGRDRPMYLYFGTIDTHAPWFARKPWIDTYSPNYKGPFQQLAGAEELGFKPDSMGCSIIPPAPEIERLRAIYDSAISYQDQLVGQVVAKLKDWGIWDQTLLVITSDHGDELFEDRRCGHGGSLRDSLVRVPLLVHDPSRFPGGTVVDEGAEGVDLMPTILDALGIVPPAGTQGESLIGLAQGGGRGWARPSYASMYEYAHAMRIGRWKLTVGSGVLSVVDLVADPTEMVNVIAKHPVERRMLTDNLGMFLALRAQWDKRAWGVTTSITRAGAAALDEVKTP